jgi:hypothetical protein
VKNWEKVKPHLGDPELNDVLVRDFNKLTEGRWGKKFRHGQFPREFENTDWDDLILDGIDTVDWDEADYDKFFRDFREPEYWRYVKHGASRWLVNFTLRLAQLVEPKSLGEYSRQTNMRQNNTTQCGMVTSTCSILIFKPLTFRLPTLLR